MDQISSREQAPRAHQYIDVMPLDPGNSQHLGDRPDGKPAGTFDTVEPLLGNRGQQPVIIEQRCRRIMWPTVQTEDQHRV